MIPPWSPYAPCYHFATVDLRIATISGIPANLFVRPRPYPPPPSNSPLTLSVLWPVRNTCSKYYCTALTRTLNLNPKIVDPTSKTLDP